MSAIRLENTGAMRSGDLDKERWDLLSGVAIERLLNVADLDFSDQEPQELVKAALALTYQALGLYENSYHSKFVSIPVEHREATLVRAWWHLCWAIQTEKMGDATVTPLKVGQYLYYPLSRIAAACAEGVVKYGEENWHNGFRTKEILSHAIAHMVKWLNGFKDEDDLGHAAWNFMAAVHNSVARPELNDLLLGSAFSLTDELRQYHERKRLEKMAAAKDTEASLHGLDDV